MERSLMKPWLFFIILCSLWSGACRKGSSPYQPTVELASKINSWLAYQRATAGPAAARIDLLKKNLDLSGIRFEQSDQGEKIVIIPITNGLKTLDYVGQSSIPSLVLILDNTGNIRKGNLVLYMSRDEQPDYNLPPGTFYHVFNTATPECDGQFRFLSVTGRWLYQLEYRDNKLYSYSIAGPKAISDVNNTNAGQLCIDWYIVTTVTYSDGSTYTTEEYIGTTCGCISTVPARYNIQDPGCEDGGTGGGGGGENEEYEFALSKPVDWVVSQHQLYWVVKSREKLTGKKVAGEPQGGHFTDIAHLSSYLALGNSSKWEEFSAVVSLDDIRLAHAYVQGKVTYLPLNYWEVVSADQTWKFGQVF